MARKAKPNEAPPSIAPEPVAQYVRMSTDHQRYSIENQQAAIAEYARTRNMEVVKTYADPGRSGLTLAGRPGLRELLRDVTAGGHQFSAVLIYDVSRWGRFQDVDESAHYEFLLRNAGLRVIYSAEPFDNDGTALSAILKTIKRTMAGEHSREMSVKIRAAARRNEQKGYWHGSPVQLGLRRMCVDAEGRERGVLTENQRKHQPSDHVVLVPGPPDEVAIVRKVFELFTDEGWTLIAISAWLAEQGHRRPYGRPWTPEAVRRMLEHEAYVGTIVRGKNVRTLGGPNRRQPRDCWRRIEGVVTPIIDRRLFERTQAILDVRYRIKSDEEVLDALRDLLRRRGRLSMTLIEGDRRTPSVTVLRNRFGGLMEAYARIGYRPINEAAGVYLDLLEGQRAALRAAILAGFKRRGVPIRPLFGGRLLVDERLFIGLSVLTPLQLSKAGPPAWRLMRGETVMPDVRVVLRLDGPQAKPMDYIIIPKAGCDAKNLTLHRKPRTPYDRYRHNTLDPLFALAAAQLLEARVREGAD